MVVRVALALSLLVILVRPPCAAQPHEDATLALPKPGDRTARLLAPDIIELTTISAPAKGERAPDLAREIHAGDFQVAVDNAAAAVRQVGFKRAPVYAPLRERDLRVATAVYLRLEHPIPNTAHEVIVTERQNGAGGSGELKLVVAADPFRYSPAIHVNQEGYTPKLPKVAMVGYYTGTLGELPIPADSFDLIDAETRTAVFHGNLRARRDIGFPTRPMPYQAVYEADFSGFDQPGEYRLVVPGLGASLPFRIDPGELMNAVRAYALGLYHQRCGVALELPFTRFTHEACHAGPAEVPIPAREFSKTWEVLASAANDRDKPEDAALQIRSAQNLFYPYVRTGKVDVRGGHHDAGDYSKYVIDSAALVHALVFAVDAFPGVAELDNLGLPESGDGVPDVLQEAKLESDFLSRMQDEDGGFYFLVYPKTRRYEDDVLPDHGDPQVVWPKTTSVTAAAVAALAQCSSSAEFQKHFAADAKRYREQALLGWKFLLSALDAHGERGAYQRLTHYGDDFADRDELAWAAAELFVATGDPQYEKKLREWFPNPTDPATMQWGWRHASFSYGNALRAYAFAPRTGRLPRTKLDSGYLQKCELELRRAGDDAERDAERSAYGVSYPEASKRIVAAGWFFASDQAFDITVAHQLRPFGRYLDAVVSNLNFELGTNPLNRSFITGLGAFRQREIVDQYAENDDRALPPSGIPIGCLQSRFDYVSKYGSELTDQCSPKWDDVPLYDRWADVHNVTTEFVVVNQARSLASLAYWAAQTDAKAQPWKSAPAKIYARAANGSSATFYLECPGVSLKDASIVWEARDHQPAFGASFTAKFDRPGKQWVEAEACLPDGRRVFARTEFRANSAEFAWVSGALPAGATTSARGGDEWNWTDAPSAPPKVGGNAVAKVHVSAVASGIHDHAFDDARDRMEVEPGDVLFADVFLDPAHPPKTLMLEWNDGSFDHRAYWGPNTIPWGHVGTPSQQSMGDMPAKGKWVRLKVPAKLVGLEGHAVKGMAFRLYDGRAYWGAAGKLASAQR